MDEDMNKDRNEIEIDFVALFKLLNKNMKLILITMLLCAIMAFLATSFLITKKYASEARIYLVPRVSEQGVIDYNAINTNSKMVNNYVSMLKGETVLSKVAEKLEITDMKDVKSSLSVSNETNTEIISVKAITDDPKKSQQIAATTIDVFFKEMKDKLDIKNMTTLDEPKINEVPVSPNKKIYTAIGGMLGLGGSCGYVLLKYLLDKRLRTREEAESFLGIPVLGEIPWYED